MMGFKQQVWAIEHVLLESRQVLGVGLNLVDREIRIVPAPKQHRGRLMLAVTIGEFREAVDMAGIGFEDPELDVDPTRLAHVT